MRLTCTWSEASGISTEQTAGWNPGQGRSDSSTCYSGQDVSLGLPGVATCDGALFLAPRGSALS